MTLESDQSYHQASLVAQLVKNLSAMQETWIRSLGWEDPLEKGTAAHSSVLAWRILWTESTGSSTPLLSVKLLCSVGAECP